MQGNTPVRAAMLAAAAPNRLLPERAMPARTPPPAPAGVYTLPEPTPPPHAVATTSAPTQSGSFPPVPRRLRRALRRPLLRRVQIRWPSVPKWGEAAVDDREWREGGTGHVVKELVGELGDGAFVDVRGWAGGGPWSWSALVASKVGTGMAMLAGMQTWLGEPRETAGLAVLLLHGDGCQMERDLKSACTPASRQVVIAY